LTDLQADRLAGRQIGQLSGWQADWLASWQLFKGGGQVAKSKGLANGLLGQVWHPANWPIEKLADWNFGRVLHRPNISAPNISIFCVLSANGRAAFKLSWDLVEAIEGITGENLFVNYWRYIWPFFGFPAVNFISDYYYLW
jgi:hypothetical protein